MIFSESELSHATRLCEEMLEALRKFRFMFDGKLFHVSASIGLTELLPTDRISHTEIMSTVDGACIAAKDEGGNRVKIYKLRDRAIVERQKQLEWVSRIHVAIEKGLFCIYHQMMESLEPDAPLHCELLIRMLSEDGTFTYPPKYFLPVAERYQLMPEIDRWVINEALRIIATKDAKYECVYAINLSGQTLSDENFPEFVMERIKHYGVSATSICFEITETAVIENIDRAKYFMSRLRDLGCSFSLDDFGSGLSSFGYLKSLKVDYLKIDGIFVRNILNDTIDLAMVESINHIGHTINLKTIAEFAENEEIVSKLRTIGIDYFQGYAVMKPELFR